MAKRRQTEVEWLRAENRRLQELAIRIDKLSSQKTVIIQELEDKVRSLQALLERGLVA